MPPISQEKKDKISEQILFHLYNQFPKQLFTADIAREIARDEEFVKAMMIELEKKELAVRVEKNQQGVTYSRRIRWRIASKVYEAYKGLNSGTGAISQQTLQTPKTNHIQETEDVD